MIIDFDKVEEKTIPNFKGGELSFRTRMTDDGSNKIMKGCLVPGATIGMHTHDSSSEIIFILSGTGTVVTDNGEEVVFAGMCHYCPKGAGHSLQNRGNEDLVFFAVVPEQ